MTRKHYKLIAQVLNAMRPDISLDSEPYVFAQLELWESVVENLADEFQRDNPKFNRYTFYKACGYAEF